MNTIEDISEGIKNIVSKAQYANGQLDLSSILSDIAAISRGGDLFSIYDPVVLVLQRPLSQYHGGIPQSEIDYYLDKIYSLLEDPFIDSSLYIKLPFKIDTLDPDGYNLNSKVTIINVSSDTINIINAQNKFTDMVREQSDFFQVMGGESYDSAKDNDKRVQAYKVPQGTLCYLRVTTKASFKSSGISTKDIDPLHIWKIIVAVMLSRGLLVNHGLLKALTMLDPRNENDRTDLGVLLAYDTDMTYMASTSLPYNESQLMKDVSESAEFSGSNRKLDFIKDISRLINKYNNSYLETERLRIINSLYWFFEFKTTKNIGFKTLLLESMFDAFLASDKKNYSGDTIKAIINDVGLKEGSKEHQTLVTSYAKRNDVAHGKIHLLDTDVSRHSPILSDDQMRIVEEIYKKYINHKITLLLE